MKMQLSILSKHHVKYSFNSCLWDLMRLNVEYFSFVAWDIPTKLNGTELGIIFFVTVRWGRMYAESLGDYANLRCAKFNMPFEGTIKKYPGRNVLKALCTVLKV